MDTFQNPWITLCSNIQYDNTWIQVTEHEVIHPSGKPGIYGTIHFKNRAVGVVPYEAGYVWLVGQFRYPLGQFSWEIPEGGGPKGEDPVNTAHRELKEETGFTASRIETLLQIHLSNSVSDEWGILYLATGLTAGEPEPDDTEMLFVKKWKLEDVYEEIEAGRITDSLTVAAIYKMMILKLQGKLPEYP